jgi:hypothetical protein
VGDVDTDPEIVGNQKQLSVLQEDTSVVEVDQPVLTGAGGVPIHNGSPVTILVDGDYALKVLNSSGSQIYYVPSATSFEDESIASVNDMLGLVGITDQADGDKANMTGYFVLFPQAEFSGGGSLVWQENLDKTTANGGTIIDPDNIGGFDGTVATLPAFLAAQGGGVGIGCWVRTQTQGNTITSSMFGAVDDDSIDSNAALQASLTFIQDNGGKLVFDGLYGTSVQLDILVDKHWSIEGLKSKSTSGIKALADIDYILSIAETGATFQGEIYVSGLFLDCNLMSGGIDTGLLRYYTIEENRITRLGTDKIGINGGGWVVRILNNSISTQSPTQNGIGLNFNYPSSPGVQNYLIKDNNFLSLHYGITGDSATAHNNTQIIDNTFEECTVAAMWFKNFTRQLNIKGNYFETCGGVSTDVTGGGSLRYGVLVFSSTSTGFRGVTIHKNLFSNCMTHGTPPSADLISLENPVSFDVYDNVARNGTYDSLVTLDGIGVVGSVATGVSFIHKDDDSAIARLVIDNVTTSAGYGNFAAKHTITDENTAGRFQQQVPDLFQDAASWTTSASATFTRAFEAGVVKHSFTTAAAGQSSHATTSTPAVLDSLKGKYCRVVGRVKPGSPATNGLEVIYSLKTTGTLDQVFKSSRSGTTNVRVTDGQVVYIPTDATEVRILVDTVDDVAGVSDMEIYNLKFVETTDL